MMRRQMETYCELALADCSVLVGRALTEPERRLIRHTVDLMFTIATGIHTRNAELEHRLRDCPEPPPEMDVVA